MLSIKKICKAHWHSVPFTAHPGQTCPPRPRRHSASQTPVDKPHPSWQSDCAIHNIVQQTIPSSVQAQHDNTILIEPSNKLELPHNITYPAYISHILFLAENKNKKKEKEKKHWHRGRRIACRKHSKTHCKILLFVGFDLQQFLLCLSLSLYMYVCYIEVYHVCEIKRNQIMPSATTCGGVKWLQSKNTLDFLHPYEKRTINIMRFHGIYHSASALPPSPLHPCCLMTYIWVSLCVCVANIANVIRL